MPQIPKRTSLISLTAEAVYQAIEEGLWLSSLPGERELADRFQVSRPTLREALKILQREGIIDVSHGKRRQILVSHRDVVPPRTVVAAVSQMPPHLMSPMTTFYMNELRKHVQKSRLQLEVITDPGVRHSMPHQALETLVSDRNIACWILLSVTEKTQHWFAGRNLPTLIVGSCYPGVTLPSLDIDYRAVCRHAVATFLRNGHRGIAFLTPANKVAGDEASEDAFSQAVHQSGHSDARGTIIHHNGTRVDICRKLARISVLERPPTALLVSRPLHLLTAHTFLLKQGVRIPGQLSLICRDNDAYLGQLVPDVARYLFRRRHFADRLSRLAIQLATTGNISPRQYHVVPQFHAGETIAPPGA